MKTRLTHLIILTTFGIFIVTGCQCPSTPTGRDQQAQAVSVSASDEKGLTKQCKTLLHEFQSKFDRTASKSGMPDLLSWYHDSLNRLMEQYKPTLVTETILNLCKTDSVLKHPVPGIVMKETESHNKTSRGDVQ